MPDRRDAFLAAAEIDSGCGACRARHRIARHGRDHRDLPGVSRRCEQRAERSAAGDRHSRYRSGSRDAVHRAVETSSMEICARRRIGRAWETVNADAPAQCAPEIVAVLSEACQNSRNFRGCRWSAARITTRSSCHELRRLRCCSSRMCRNGYSHRPDEYASPEDIVRGTLILAEASAIYRREFWKSLIRGLHLSEKTSLNQTGVGLTGGKLHPC